MEPHPNVFENGWVDLGKVAYFEKVTLGPIELEQ